MSDNGKHLNIDVDGYRRHGDSPTSDMGQDYVGESSEDEITTDCEPPSVTTEQQGEGINDFGREDNCTGIVPDMKEFCF